MRRRADRYLVELAAEVYLEGWQESAPVQDVSVTGMFVQTSTQVMVGAKVALAIAPEGRAVGTVGTVTHALGPSQAHERSRFPGFGVAFREPESPSDQLFALAIARLIRTQRIATTRRVVLSGALDHLTPPALLAMLELERKTGRLTLAGETWIDLVDGRIVDAGPATGPHGALATVLTALDRTHGTFEFATGDQPRGKSAIVVTQVLLEHARLRDEASRLLAC